MTSRMISFEALAEGLWSRCPGPQWTEEHIYVHEDPSNMYPCISLWKYAKERTPNVASEYTHIHLPKLLWKMAYVTSTDWCEFALHLFDFVSRQSTKINSYSILGKMPSLPMFFVYDAGWWNGVKLWVFPPCSHLFCQMRSPNKDPPCILMMKHPETLWTRRHWRQLGWRRKKTSLWLKKAMTPSHPSNHSSPIVELYPWWMSHSREQCRDHFLIFFLVFYQFIVALPIDMMKCRIIRKRVTHKSKQPSSAFEKAIYSILYY